MTTPKPPASKPPAKSNKAVDAEVRRLFGEVAAFLSHPELGPILRKAAAEGWDNSRLFGALQQTKYWKTTAEPTRKWQILSKLDPAEAQRQVQVQALAVSEIARSLGFTYNEGQVRYFAGLAASQGWSSSQLREHLLNRERNQYGKGDTGNFETLVGQQYGYLAAYLDHPEVGPLLVRAAREGWDERRLAVELQKTQFWTSTTDSQRRWDALVEQSAGDAQQQVDGRAGEIVALGRQFGVTLTPERAREIATESLRSGWSAQQVQQAVTREYEYGGGTERATGAQDRRRAGSPAERAGFGRTPDRNEFGVAGQAEQQIRALAGEYLVPMSPQTMERWVEQIVRGEVDINGFRSYLTEQAKSLFPGMSAALDRGVTVAQYADPYRQIAARELELNPDSIDLNDPKFRKMLDQVNGKGERVSMTLSESTEYLRRLPEWQRTRGANEKAAALTENILRTFGAVA